MKKQGQYKVASFDEWIVQEIEHQTGKLKHIQKHPELTFEHFKGELEAKTASKIETLKQVLAIYNEDNS